MAGSTPGLLCSVAAVTAAAAMSDGNKPRTNFVVLFMDDNGWGDAGVSTNGSVAETPRIDRMAAQGGACTAVWSSEARTPST